jgi:transcriptional regulator with XRE-family HTH domain
MRRGLSLEEAASLVEVTARTLRRWEKLEVWPSVEQLHRLCFALQAHEEEVVSLTVGQFSQKPSVEKMSLEAIQERLKHLKRLENQPSGYPLFELDYLQLQRDAWPLAMCSAAGKQVLIAISAYYAQCLSFRERLSEAGTPLRSGHGCQPDIRPDGESPETGGVLDLSSDGVGAFERVSWRASSAEAGIGGTASLAVGDDTLG